MPLIDNNWFSLNTTRSYPVDSNATGIGDAGNVLKDDIILDLRLKWPAAAGQYAFLSGLTITDNLVTAVFLATNDVNVTTGFTPLASITLNKPVDSTRLYNLTAIYPGTAGFIAFGDVNENYSIRLSTPSQGLISPKVGKPYNSLPITGLKKQGRVDSLTGLVKIVGEQDVEINKKEVLLEGVTKEALVLSLVAPTDGDNVLSKYTGPCGKRPESLNCVKNGIETINGVRPDCDGNINIVFKDLTVGNYQDCGSLGAGVTLDQQFGLEDVCVNRHPQRFAGEYACVESSSSVSSSSSISSSSSESASSESSLSQSSISESAQSSVSVSVSSSVGCDRLPFLECFDFDLHDSWDLKIGNYDKADVESPDESCLTELVCLTPWSSQWSSSWSSSESSSTASGTAYGSHSSDCLKGAVKSLQLNDTSRRNALVWEDCSVDTSLDKRVTSHVQLTNSGTRFNAGLVLNYHTVDPFTNPRTEYFIAQINKNDNKVELVRFNGSTLIVENAATPATPFSFGDWFRIQAEVHSSGGGVSIAVSVENISNTAWPDVNFTVVTNQWNNPDGHYGVHTNRAISNFSFWRLEDA